MLDEGVGKIGTCKLRYPDGLERREAVLVLMVASSASFLTPISYQTNLMVMEPGKYEFLDYLKFGFGLQVVVIAAIILVAWVSN